MSNKLKNNNNKNKNNNNNNNNTKQDKYLSLLERHKQRREICKKHHIDSWLIFCFPIGIYKSFKYKAYPLFINLLFSLIGLSIISLIILFARNPYGLTNLTIQDKILSFTDTGKVYDYSYLGAMDDKYSIYEIYSEGGTFNLWLNKDKKYNIEYIKASNSSHIINNSSTINKKYNEVFPEIMLFFEQESNIDKFGTLKEVDKTINTDITSDLNLTYQSIKTNKGLYLIGCNFNQVLQILDVNDINNVIYERKPNILLPQKVKQIINKNKDTIGKLKFVYNVYMDENGINYQFCNTKNKHFKITEDINRKFKLYKSKNEDLISSKSYEYINRFNEIN